MSYYYDPFYPSLEATRMEIQRSFLALEQKLRVQRQLDLDLDVEHRFRRDRSLDLATYEDELRLRENLIKNDYVYDRVYDRQLADKIKYSQEEQQHNLRYLSKLERLQRERLQLSRQRPNKSYDMKVDYSGNRSPYKNISVGYQNEEDDKLVKKYEDGTRARQIKQDIVSRSKYNSSSKNRPEDFNENNRSPYRNLDFGSTSKPFSNQKLSHLGENYKNGSDIRQERAYGGKSYQRDEGRSYQRDERDERRPYQRGEENFNQPRFGSIDKKKDDMDPASRKLAQATAAFQNKNNSGLGQGQGQGPVHQTVQRYEKFYSANQLNSKNQPGSGMKGSMDQFPQRKNADFTPQQETYNYEPNYSRSHKKNGGFKPQQETYNYEGNNLQSRPENTYAMPGFPGENKKTSQENENKNKRGKKNEQNIFGGMLENLKGGNAVKYAAYNSSISPTKNKLSYRGRSKSQKQLTKTKQNASPYKSFFEPKTDRSPLKSKWRSKKESDQKQSQIPAQQSAMQKIKNRLKLSEVVYEDSAYHNTKHELNHLFNTYDCQCRLRKELKMKINTHPAVLRKHAMVVE